MEFDDGGEWERQREKGFFNRRIITSLAWSIFVLQVCTVEELTSFYILCIYVIGIPVIMWKVGHVLHDEVSTG